MSLIEDKILKYSNVNLNNLVYSKHSTNGEYKQIHINYNDNGHLHPLIVGFPSLYCFDSIEIKGNIVKVYELLTTLLTRNTKEQESFLNFIKQLEIKVCQDVKDHEFSSNNKWFNKKPKFKRIIKDTDNKNNIYKYGILKIRGYQSNNFETVFIHNKKKLHDSQIPEIFMNPCYIKPYIEIVSLCIKDNLFFIYLRPHLIKISYGSPPIPMISQKNMDSETEFEEKTFSDALEELSEKINSEKED